MPTSGPIVRTGTTPEFWKNWDNVFGDKSKKAGSKPAKPEATPKKSAAKKKPAKSAARKKSAKK